MSVTPITHKSPARRDADMMRVLRYVEEQRRRMYGDQEVLDLLNAEITPRKSMTERLRRTTVTGKPKVRIVGPDERPRELQWNAALDGWG